MQNSTVYKIPILKPVLAWATTLAVGIAFITNTTIIYNVLSDFLPKQQTTSPTPKVNVPVVTKIIALGNLKPDQKVIQLSASTSTEGNRIEQVLVKRGDDVTKGQIIAILDSRERLEAFLERAKEQVKVAQARVQQIKAGPKVGEIKAEAATTAKKESEQDGNTEAQQAIVARLEAELNNARRENLRYQTLYQKGAISASTSDSKRLTVETLQQQVNEAKANLSKTKKDELKEAKEAKATLSRMAEIRPVDVKVAQAEVKSAISAVKQAQANLNRAYVRAPSNGQILKINYFPGEVVGKEGIVDFGQTSQMFVVAEVHGNDISKVHPGQRAIISSNAFPGELQGTVRKVGLQVLKQDVLDTNPTANTDTRVVEVEIRLDPAASRKVVGLSNLQVKVAISF